MLRRRTSRLELPKGRARNRGLVHRASRLVRKAQKIRRRLGGEPGLIHPFPAKPKGMHWHTYQRLRAEAELAEDYSWITAAERFGLLPKELRK